MDSAVSSLINPNPGVLVPAENVPEVTSLTFHIDKPPQLPSSLLPTPKSPMYPIPPYCMVEMDGKFSA